MSYQTLRDLLDNIERGIPVPQPLRAGLADVAEKLEPGESVLVDDDRTAKSLYRAIVNKGRKAASRKVPGKGWRVWRLA